MTKQAFTPKFQTAAAIEKAIGSIQTRGKKLDNDIQQCGLSILAHIEKCGDITLFERLFAAMPAGSRRNALVEWATKYGKLSVNLDEKSKKDKPFLYAKGQTTNIDGAIEEPWYNCKPEKPVDQEFDFASKLQALLRSAKAARDAGKPVKGADVLDRLLNLDAEPAAKPVAMALPADDVAA